MTHSSSLTANDILHSMPRICELITLVIDRRSHDAFFQNFEETVVTIAIKKGTFQAIEAEVQKLSAEAWEGLKKKAASYLNKKDTTRAWQQVIDCLNEEKGYNYLQDIGCSDVVFIPEDSKKTPDLEGTLGGKKALCDVKTINHSDAEIKQRPQTGIVGSSSISLPKAFLQKIHSTAESAKTQIDAYYPDNAKKIVYFVVNFDDWSHDYQEEHFKEIRQHFTNNPIGGLEMVLCDRPRF